MCLLGENSAFPGDLWGTEEIQPHFNIAGYTSWHSETASWACAICSVHREACNSTITEKHLKLKLLSTKHSKAGGCSRGGADYCTSYISDIMVMLPSHLLYFPIPGKLYLISALPLRLFGRLLKWRKLENKAQSEEMECNLEMENWNGKGSLAEMLFGW